MTVGHHDAAPSVTGNNDAELGTPRRERFRHVVAAVEAPLGAARPRCLDAPRRRRCILSPGNDDAAPKLNHDHRPACTARSRHGLDISLPRRDLRRAPRLVTSFEDPSCDDNPSYDDWENR